MLLKPNRTIKPTEMKYSWLILVLCGCFQFNNDKSTFYVSSLLNEHNPNTNDFQYQYFLDDIAECIRNNTTKKDGKKPKVPKKDKMFSIYYGYAAVEILNAIDNDQISQILALSACLAAEEEFETEFAPSVKNFSSLSHEQNRYLHSSNDTVAEVTINYLNGYLQLLLPDVHRSLLTAANLGLRKSQWHDKSPNNPSIEDLGIRSIHIHNIHIPGMEEFQITLKETVERKRYSHVFSIGGGSPSDVPEPPSYNMLLQDTSTEEFAAHFLNSVYGNKEGDEEGDGTVYTMILLLSPRNAFVGAEVWVQNHLQSEADESEEDDEDDEVDNSNEIDPTRKHHKAWRLGSKVSKLTPEKGSLVLIQSAYAHGHSPLLVGSRQMLVVELWPFKDSPVGSRRPDLTEATSFSPSHDFRLDL